MMRLVPALLLLSACMPSYFEPSGPAPDPDQVADDDPHLQGAGGRDLREFWETLEVPFSANTKMLAFDMMKSEVLRATGLSWEVAGVDQWERNREVFGGADYSTTFVEDITPSQQKILLWRKMAWQVCLDAVNRDAGQTTRVLFTEVDPAAPIAPGNVAVATQIRNLYERFFLDPPTDQDVADAQALLSDAYSDGSDAKEAWRALCVGYLGSMRFLTY